MYKICIIKDMKNNKHIFKIYAYKKQKFEVEEIGHIRL